MSFLNPVNEPVLRFSSTDSSAPQISYGTRTIGDVKAIIKACLVTGYGSKDSAGWSITNEVGGVAEFTSPSAEMSNYSIGIDDSSTSTTTWFYRYNGTRVNPSSNALTKSHSNINLTSVKNGWQLLVTKQGFTFIEILDDTIALGLVTRVTYFGRIKSALKNTSGANIAFWSVGHSSSDPTNFWAASSSPNKYFITGDYTSASIVVINSVRTTTYIDNDTTSAVELVSAWYLYNFANFMGEQPGILLTVSNINADRFKVENIVSNGRPVLSVPVSYATGDLDRYNKYTRTLLIYTDFWGY
jgi:hypothetical protein